MSEKGKIKDFLDKKLEMHFNQSFILSDPICIPHLFSKKQDIEIAAFFAAIFAWGNRTTIINKSRDLMEKMDMSPHDFCLHASPSQLRNLRNFKHRTFNADDLYYFIEFFRHHYTQHKSLETAFISGLDTDDANIEKGLVAFRRYFLSLEHLKRTEKHISSPLQNSACKRINMFLRWMVRKDVIDFGIWKHIKPSQLICPLDLHVSRVAKKFGLITRPRADWQSAVELTENLKKMDPLDPVKYDIALFSLGAVERF
jgi:uncharacterized protein (TIGR02757 family)